MNPPELLKALRDHGLQEFYMKMYKGKLLNTEFLSQLSEQELSTTLGVEKSEIRKKFMDLSKFVNNKVKAAKNNDSFGAGSTNDKRSPVRSTPNSIVNTSNSSRPTISPKRHTASNSNSRSSSSSLSASPRLNNGKTASPKSNYSSSKPTYTVSHKRFVSDDGIMIPTTSNTKSIIPTELNPSKKRAYPSSSSTSTTTITATRLSPERKSRRMTLGPQSAIQRTPPSKAPVSNRRLSYLPSSAPPLFSATINKRRESSIFRPASTSSHPKPSSPTRKQQSLKKPRLLDDYSIVEVPKDPIIEKTSARLLDAYGIPITSRSQASSNRIVNENSQSSNPSLEEYMASKAKATATPKITTLSNGLPLVSSDLDQRIRVCVRKRPLNKKEIGAHESDIVPMVGARTIELQAPRTSVDLSRYTEKFAFTFDDTFDSHASNTEMYARTAQPLVNYIFGGGKATCFAYGQTGSGKTYTMLDPDHGLYVLAAQDIFRMLSKPAFSHLSASIGFYEIYQGQLYDLLNQRAKLTPRDDGNGNVIIAGLYEYAVNDVKDLLAVFEYGNSSRTTGQTGANNKSSRSHAVLQVLLKKPQEKKVYGKLSFIDLAGSERGADRGEADPKTRMEGAEINKSLLALKECIRALDQNHRHTNYRGSKLTQVLRDSFTGDSRTCMIATISPNNSNSEHTLNTLRYADRVKQLKGESDPRLLGASNGTTGSQLLPLSDDGDDEDFDYDDKEDNDSLTDFYEDGNTNENLFDVDFPTTAESDNALNTPQNDRFYSAITVTTVLDEDRQQKLMDRLESPPSEVFGSTTNIMDDPFLSHPITPSSEIKAEQELSSPSLEATILPASLMDTKKMRAFLNLHRQEIKDNEESLRQEQTMIANLAKIIASQETFPGGDHDSQYEQCKQEYENYLNDLEELLDRKMAYVEILRSKIKPEFTLDDSSL